MSNSEVLSGQEFVAETSEEVRTEHSVDPVEVDPTEPRQLLLATLLKHTDADKWVGSPFEAVKRVSNTKVGSVGQDFLESYALQMGLDAQFPLNQRGTRATQSPWDIQLNGIKFELKTATEDVSGKFQFNHIRYHRPYDAVICLGIAPADIFFGIWSKADLATGKAGRLVSMEKGANASYKLTKGEADLFEIEAFAEQFEIFQTKWDL